MRALLLSDIHANLHALEAVLHAAPPCDVAWNLGDTVGYGAFPNQAIDRVQPLCSLFVRGNHDRACALLTPLDDFNPVAARAAQWTREVLEPRHVAWLRSLPPGPVQPASAAVSCVHGSSLDEDAYLLSLRDAWRPLREAVTRISFFGHTHIQGGFAATEEEWFQLAPQYGTTTDMEEYVLPLRDGARYLINPGSVGQPRDGDRRAAFAIYDDLGKAIHFYRIPYDVHEAQQGILRMGLPHRLADRLREGR